MKSFLTVILTFVSLTSTLFSQQIILSTFETDDEGWSVVGGILYYRNSDGNPVGFIEFEDNQDGAGLFLVPGKFLGDLTSYNHGSLIFDLTNTYDNGDAMLSGYGRVKIASPSLFVERNIVPFEYISSWTTFTIPFTASDWGLTESAWDSILSEVTEISIQVDAQWNYYDKVGLDNFTISPFTTGIYEYTDASIPTSYNLHQNYPNPFKPSTFISYQLPIGGSVTLKIYDILGSDVATLVNEYKQAGSYVIEFNPGNIMNMASGVYFYQLRAGTFVDTKVLLLLR